jgi:hypothetical protein
MSPVELTGVDPQSVATITYSDGGWRVGVRDIRGNAAVLARVLDLVEASHSLVRSFSFSMGGVTDDAWKSPHESWTGAALLVDDSVPIDPNNHFDPEFPAPCYGMVPPHVPLRVLKEPKGHLVMAKWEKVFSTRLCEHLKSSGNGGVTTDVLLDGQRLPGWHRFVPSERLSVLTADAVHPFRCVGCGTPGTTGVGVLLGRRLPDLTVCQEELGWWHLNSDHEVIVSVAVAQDLERRIGRGYGLRPIVDVESPWGQAMAAILPRVKRLAMAAVS